jgi:ribosomal protein S19
MAKKHLQIYIFINESSIICIVISNNINIYNGHNARKLTITLDTI